MFQVIKGAFEQDGMTWMLGERGDGAERKIAPTIGSSSLFHNSFTMSSMVTILSRCGF
jgi:hypothetical protein